MKTSHAILMLAVLLGATTTASAHRLDEYLQATTFSVEKDCVTVRMRLTPGVSVVDKILATIDSDRNGIVSDAEQRAYSQQVIGDLAFTIDGRPAQLQLASYTFPTIDEMKGGLGDIVLEMNADLPAGAPAKTLTFENHHQSAFAAYLVNCLVPRDRAIQVVAQKRNINQSFYRLDFTIGAGAQPSQPESATASPRESADQSAKIALVETYFVHGVHHILTGYDHLLFVSALVLAATTLWDLLKVVTAFTLAHSITLTLAALNLVHLPEWVVEPLISASIVFVAVQNIFWPARSRGRTRLAAAFFFGLFHGLGFAGGLLDLMHQMPRGMVLLAILGFSVGVEAGHQMVLLPLFGFLKAARRVQPDAVMRTRLSMAFQRIGSAGISIAGVYYLALALTGNS